MSVTTFFDDYTFDEFDALDFDAFDALDALPESHYEPRLKRASSVAGGLSFLTVYPLPHHPDGQLTAADRLHVGGQYRGIAAASPNPIPVRDEGHLAGGLLPLAGGLA